MTSAFCFIILLACTENENSLLNDVDISFQGIYVDEIMGSGDMKAWIARNYDIIGFGNGNSFRTSEEFQNVAVSPGSSRGDILYNNLEY